MSELTESTASFLAQSARLKKFMNDLGGYLDEEGAPIETVKDFMARLNDALADEIAEAVLEVAPTLAAEIESKAAKVTALIAAGLATGGGDLSANRTITVPKADNATADAGTDDATAMTPLQVKRRIDAAVAALMNGAPGALDTLLELAAAMGNDPNFAATVTNEIATKAAKTTTLTAAGLATGGGDLSANRTITVPKADDAMADAGADDATAMTPLQVRRRIDAAGEKMQQSLVIGVPAETVLVTGAAIGTNTYGFIKAAPGRARAKAVRAFAMASGNVLIKRFVKVGNVWTYSGLAGTIALVAGPNNITAALPEIIVEAHERIALYGPGILAVVTETAVAPFVTGTGNITTNFTGSTITGTTQIQFGIDFELDFVTTTRVASIESDLIKKQVIGRPSDAVLVTGSVAGNATFAYLDVIEFGCTLTRFRAYIAVAGNFIVKREIIDPATGDTAQVGPDYPITVAVGPNDLSSEVGDFTAIPFERGESLGLYAYSGSGMFRLIAATGDGAGYINSASSSGNVTSFTDNTPSTTNQLQISFEFTANRLDGGAEVAAETRQLADQARVTADETNAIALETRAVLGEDSTYTFGRTAAPIDGTAVSNSTYVYKEKVPFSGPADYVEIWSKGVGTAKVSFWDRDSETNQLTKISTNIELPLVVGHNIFDASEGDFTALKVPAGCSAGIYAPSLLAFSPDTTSDSGGWYSGSGDSSSFVDGVPVTTARLEWSIRISGFVLTNVKKRLDDLEAAVGGGALPYPIVLADWNGAIGYGQSNRIGRTATPPMSTTPSVLHKTFGVGTKMTKPGISGGTNADDGNFKDLVEDSVVPDSGGACGETGCWTMAAAATRRAVTRGAAPYALFCSTAAKGGAGISAIGFASSWFQNFQYHYDTARAHAEAEDKSYSLILVHQVHGEEDQANGQTEAYYRPLFSGLVAGVNEMVAANQDGYVHFLCTLCSAYITTSSCQADAVQAESLVNPLVHVVAPDYFLPRSVDGVHWTNASQVLMGSYFGRAGDQVVESGNTQSFKFGRSVLKGSTLTIYCDVPGQNVVIDTENIGAAAQHGFHFKDDVAPIASTSIAVDGTVLTVALASVPGAGFTWSYAKTVLGAGMTIEGGASGNIRDDTEEPDLIDGVLTNRPHWAPAVTCTPDRID